MLLSLVDVTVSFAGVASLGADVSEASASGSMIFAVVFCASDDAVPESESVSVGVLSSVFVTEKAAEEHANRVRLSRMMNAFMGDPPLDRQVIEGFMFPSITVIPETIR
jgi:hypothetical protein